MPEILRAMTITVDETLSVNFKCDVMPIPFWQMVVGEVVRQLEEQRQAVAAINLRNRLIEDQKNAEIAAMLASKGNPTRFSPP